MDMKLVITPTPPYDFDLNAGYVTYFKGRYATDIYENGEFRHLLDVNGNLLLARVTSPGTTESPRLDVTLQGDGFDEATGIEVKRQISRLLGVDDDLSPFYDMAARDEHLSPLARALYGLHVPSLATAYEALVLAILGQQISVHVARMLRTLIIETYGTSSVIDGEKYYMFPGPQVVADAGLEGLRAIKFSARKAEYILDISSRVATGELDLEGLRGLPTSKIVEALTSIRGVGEWTANWLLIRALDNSDGFPHGDLALQRIMGKLVDGGAAMSAQEALEYSARWSPWRTYVTTYLFASLRSGRFDEIFASD